METHVPISIESAGMTPDSVKKVIKEAFKNSAELDAEGIFVEVNGSSIVLKGKVKSFEEFLQAKNAARAIPGITQVENYIVVSN